MCKVNSESQVYYVIGPFKTYRKIIASHINSSRDRKKRNEISLSKLFCSFKDNDKEYKITWEVIKTARPFSRHKWYVLVNLNLRITG